MKTTASSIQPCLRPLSHPPGSPSWNRPLLQRLGVAEPAREAAVLLAIADGSDGPEMIFTRRKDDLVQHPGQVSFPGGGREPQDQTSIDTALREASEEIALPPSTVTPLGYLDRLDTNSGFHITPVVASISGQPDLAPQPDEVAEIFRVPVAFLLDAGNYGVRIIETDSGTYQLSEIRHQGHAIWGATAMILRNLMQRLGIIESALP